MKHTFRKGVVDMKSGATPQNLLTIPVLAADPTTPLIGQIWVNSTQSKLKLKVSDVLTYELSLV